MPHSSRKLYHVKSKIVKGVTFAILAALLYSSIGVAVKFASVTMSPQMMVWCRQTVALLIFLPIFFIDHKASFRKPNRLGLQFLRAITSLTAAYCLFYALSKLPLTNAILLSYTRPLFIPLLVFMVQGKKMEKAVWIGLTVGFFGVLLMLKPTASFELASIAGIAAGFVGAFATLCIRWLAKTQPPNQITLYYFLISAILSSIPLFWIWETPSLETTLWLILIGVLSAFYQMCITRAYRFGRATIIGGVLYSVLIFTTLYEWFIWNKIPDIWTWLGIVLICSSSIYTIMLTNKPLTPRK